MGLWYTGLQAARAGGKSQRTKSATCQRTKSAGLVALRCRMLSNPMNQFIDLRLILQNIRPSKQVCNALRGDLRMHRPLR